MNEFDISGTIVSNDDARIYDWYEIENTSPKKLKDFLAEANGENVVININSGGGDLFSGVNMYDTLKTYSGNVEIHICGLAASAASIVAMAGKCFMSPGSNMMIHNAVCTDCSNKSGKMKIAKNLTVADRGIAAVYEAKSGKSADEILKLMDEETWLDAKTALEMGLIDGILGVEQSVSFTNSAAVTLPKAVIEKARGLLSERKNTANKGVPIARLERNLNLLRR